MHMHQQDVHNRLSGKERKLNRTPENRNATENQAESKSDANLHENLLSSYENKCKAIRYPIKTKEIDWKSVGNN